MSERCPDGELCEHSCGDRCCYRLLPVVGGCDEHWPKYTKYAILREWHEERTVDS